MISSTVSRHYHEWPIPLLHYLSRRTYWLFCFLSHLLFLYKLMECEFNYFYYLYIHFKYVFMVKCSHLYMLYLWILRVTVLHQNNFICCIELSFYYIITFLLLFEDFICMYYVFDNNQLPKLHWVELVLYMHTCAHVYAHMMLSLFKCILWV